tara:strand:- start:826 stop:1161 length:336 start_codon:yes stop_codon:yes gene_type:complete
MGFIKKSWKFIVGVIGFILGLIWFMNQGSSKKVKKLKEDIKDNESETKNVDVKIEDVKKKKNVTKKKIEEIGDKLKGVKKTKPKVSKKTANRAASDLKKRTKKKVITKKKK